MTATETPLDHGNAPGSRSRNAEMLLDLDQSLPGAVLFATASPLLAGDPIAARPLQ